MHKYISYNNIIQFKYGSNVYNGGKGFFPIDNITITLYCKKTKNVTIKNLR